MENNSINESVTKHLANLYSIFTINEYIDGNCPFGFNQSLQRLKTSKQNIILCQSGDQAEEFKHFGGTVNRI